LHPTEETRVPKVAQMLQGVEGPVIAATDYMKALPDLIGRWVPGGIFALGTDGLGRSDTRVALRRFFEVDAQCVTVGALKQLADRGTLDRAVVARAITELEIDPGKADPTSC
jgi:pyruvate dehydrogenase E1 component